MLLPAVIAAVTTRAGSQLVREIAGSDVVLRNRQAFRNWLVGRYNHGLYDLRVCNGFMLFNLLVQRFPQGGLKVLGEQLNLL